MKFVFWLSYFIAACFNPASHLLHKHCVHRTALKGSVSLMKGIALLLAALFTFTGCTGADRSIGGKIAPDASSTISTAVSAEKTGTLAAQANIGEGKQKAVPQIAGESVANAGNITGGQTGDLKVHFIDVGQADSILVQTPEKKVMLIDAGNNEDGGTVVSYLKTQGISKIDIIVGTHPHEDHIGGMDTVINSFDVGRIYMPDVSTTTKTFEDVIHSMSRKGLKISAPVPGMEIGLDSAVKAQILAPNSSYYEDLNNYSIVIRLTYKNISFMFDGDAEGISEHEILSRGYNVKADVLKVGHHGSLSSTTLEFLKAVSPKFAVISVGKGNDYGHPAKETLDKLAAEKVQVFRTDESGTIVASTDGQTVRFDKKASPVKPQAPPTPAVSQKPVANSQAIKPAVKPVSAADTIVYITKTGKKYHTGSCRSLSKGKIPITLMNAKKGGYEPCSLCNPPR